MIQGRTLGLAAKYPGFMNLQTGEINPNYTPPVKQPPLSQVMNAKKTGIQLQNTYQAAMDQAEKDGDPQAYQAAAQGLAELNAQSAQTGIAPTGQPLTFEARKEAMGLGEELNKELVKPENKVLPEGWLGGKSKTKIADLTDKISKLHKDPKNLLNIQPTSQLPAANTNQNQSTQTQSSENQSPNVISVDEASKALKRPVKAGTILTDKDGNQITVQ
jgi:hypothetical protein